jgi:HYD1 signature containing ADP-ribosyltransferase
MCSGDAYGDTHFGWLDLARNLPGAMWRAATDTEAWRQKSSEERGEATAELALALASRGLSTSSGSMRVRHYTNSSSLDSIEKSGMLIAGDKNIVFAESARGRALSAADAQQKYGIGRGRGNAYVEFDVPTDRVTKVYNAGTRNYELRIRGDVQLQNPSFYRR